jgi:hypothetical protein
VDRLDHALALARQGFFILPLRAGTKLPFGGESWAEMMTRDEATIRAWFADRPNMNYGVCPGEHGVILDPDEDAAKDKHGLQVLADLESENFEEPITGETLTVRSPRGGNHLYLNTLKPISNARGSFPKDIDVRGRGGYVVGPGSHTIENAAENTAEGVYEIVCDKPAMMAPAWVIARLEEAGIRSDNADKPIYEYDQPHAIDKVRTLIQQQVSWPTEGQGGDQATYEFIALARGAAVSEEKMLELLLEPYGEDEQSWNDRCLPPWDVAELVKKVENAYRYATSAPGVKGGLLDAMETFGTEYADAAEREAEKTGSSLDALYFPGETLMQRDVHREYVIPQWLLAHGMTQMLAKRGVGKTVLMLDMALRIACDLDWHTLPIAPGWCAVYACGEDDVGLQEQMIAWTQENEMKPEDDRFIVMTATPDLMNAEEAEQWTRFILAKLKGRRAVFFVDTWQRATSHASQNDDDQMQVATDHIDAMSKSFRGPSVIAFHPPKGNDSTISGSMVIENKGSAIWRLTRESNHRRLAVDRIKGPGESNYQLFKFDIKGLGEEDQFGQERTGVLPTRLGGTGDMGESVELKALNTDARYFYGTLIRDLILYAEEHEEAFVKNRTAFFSVSNTADRILAKFTDEPNHPVKRALLSKAETSFSNRDTLRKRLGELFKDNPSAQITDDTVTTIQLMQKGSKTARFILDASPDEVEY